MSISHDIERAMVSHLMSNPTELDEFPLISKEAPFADGNLNTYLKCMKDLYENPTGLTLFKERSQIRKKFEEVTGVDGKEFVSNIKIASIHGLSGQQIYAHFVEAYQKKAIATMASGLAGSADGDNTAASIVSHIESSIKEIENFSVIKSSMTIKEAVRAVTEKMAKLADGDETVYIKTGIHCLDNVIHGLVKGELMTLACRPSIGKSAAATTMISNMAQNGFTVGMLSIEMKVEAVTERILQIRSGESVYDLATNGTEAGMIAFQREAQALSEGTNIVIEETTNRDLSNIRSIIKAMKKNNPEMSVIFLDYLQKIKSSNPKLHADPVGTISEASGAMMDLAKDLDVAIVQLAQCNRDSDGLRPTMGNLKGSSAIEEDSGTIILVHRDLKAQLEVTDNGGDPKALEAEFIVCKNRSGRTSTAHLKFNAKTTKFYDDSYDYAGGNDL